MNPLCAAEGIGLLPWSPLARGFLAGNRTREGGGETTRAQSDTFAQSWYYRDNDFEIVERVVEVAGRLEARPAQVALAWLLQRPGVVAPIIGASKMGHLEDAVAALEVKLSAEDCAYLEELYQPHPILGHQ
jgi:aryl-alcohol dehydrogenase (NADP+)